jgi:hypothetical protein
MVKSVIIKHNPKTNHQFEVYFPKDNFQVDKGVWTVAIGSIHALNLTDESKVVTLSTDGFSQFEPMFSESGIYQGVNQLPAVLCQFMVEKKNNSQPQEVLPLGKFLTLYISCIGYSIHFFQPTDLD